MRILLIFIVWNFSFPSIFAGGSAHLEPAGFGPFEDGGIALKYSRISDLLRLDDNIQGFRFMLLCIHDDGRAVLKIVREDAKGAWHVKVRETLGPIDRANAKDVVELEVQIDANHGNKMHSEIVSALREVTYDENTSKVDSKTFDTGGVETFAAARLGGAFLAGRTWNPPAGSMAYKVQEIALKLGRSQAEGLYISP